MYFHLMHLNMSVKEVGHLVVTSTYMFRSSSLLLHCCLVACIITPLTPLPPFHYFFFISGVCVCFATCCDNVVFSFHFSLCEGSGC